MVTMFHPAEALSRVRSHADAIRVIVSRHGGANPSVFGSVARGEAREESDVDFLIDHQPGISLFGLVRIERELAESLGTSVDVVVEDEVPERARGRIFGEAVGL